MKTIFISLIIAFTLLTGNALKAQSPQKFGCINANELVQFMPENDSVMQLIEQRSQEFAKQAEELDVEFRKKYDNYVVSRDSLSPLIRKAKEEELTSMSRNIETFTAAARQELDKYQQDLYQPVLTKAQNAIQEVADEQGITFVLDTSRGSLLVFPQEPPVNLMEAVKKKLGIL